MKRNPLLEHLQQTIATLQDRGAVWIYRRDAAELLGTTAAHALAALKAQEAEPDKDVAMAVKDSLGTARAGLDGVVPETLAPGGHSLEMLARACEKKGKRSVHPHGDGFEIDIQLPNDRHQTVLLTEGEAQGGTKLFRVFTVCGPADEKVMKWALRANLELPQGALALATHNGEERLVMLNTYLAAEATPDQIRAGVKAVAFYGDWVEQKTSKEDLY